MGILLSGATAILSLAMRVAGPVRREWRGWRSSALKITTLPRETAAEWTLALTFPLEGEDLECVQSVGPPNSLGDTVKIRDVLVEKFSAVDVGERSDRILIQNLGPRLAVEGISVELVERRPFEIGAIVNAPSGGPVWDVLVGFDLDEVRPECRRLNDGNGSINWAGPTGLGGVYDLASGESLPLNVMTRVATGTVLWRLGVRYRIRGKQRIQTYPAEGAALRTVGLGGDAIQRWVAGRPSPHQAITRCTPDGTPIYEDGA